MKGTLTVAFVIVVLGVSAMVSFSSAYLIAPTKPTTNASMSTTTTPTSTSASSITAICYQTESAPLYLTLTNSITESPIANQSLSIQAQLLKGFVYNETSQQCDRAFWPTRIWTNQTDSNGRIELGSTGDVFVITTIYSGKTYQISADAEGAESAECITLYLPSGVTNTTSPGLFKYVC